MIWKAIVADIQNDWKQIPVPTVPAVRQRFREHATHLKSKRADDALVLAVARQLAQSLSWTHLLIAFELLVRYPGSFAQPKSDDIERWANGLVDREGTDQFGCTIVGQTWRDGIIKDQLIAKWASSPDRWLRRLALVATAWRRECVEKLRTSSRLG